MGYIFSKLYSSLFGSNYFHILMLGLDAAGKTKILYKLKQEGPKISNPIYGFYIEEINYENFHFLVWDVGSCADRRFIWKHFYNNINILLFVVDSNDKDRDEDAKEQFEKMLNEEELKHCPVLVLANKQDIKGAYSPEEIIEKFGMNEIKGRKWCVKGVSAETGQGIKEAIDWMNLVLIEQKNN